MKTIHIEFHGGFKDGEVVSGNQSTENSSLIQIYYFLSDGWQIGKKFRLEPSSSMQKENERAWSTILDSDDPDTIIKQINSLEQIGPQLYEVKKCEENSEEILITVNAVDEQQLEGE
ncbi:MAG: hypothetical protein JXM70_18420 [Pirellulales bacterium]|nr:hypothetical protein [Pirellulales bacterium]